MKQSLDMMRTMPAEQLQAAAQAAGAPPGFFSADRVEELAAKVHHPELLTLPPTQRRSS
jgi:hypothetical protein